MQINMQTWRGVTDAEYEALCLHAEQRKAMAPEERLAYGTPTEANASWGGAVWWTFRVLSQDRPVLVLGGSIALIVQAVRVLLAFVGW